jgi:hypothetical protein
MILDLKENILFKHLVTKRNYTKVFVHGEHNCADILLSKFGIPSV